MNIIIPMAGMGKRMRPHTLTIPKPLIHVAGKPIVQHLIEEVASFSNDKIDEIAFIIGNFGDEVENNLLNIAKAMGAKGKIYYQTQPLGTAHALLCAADSLKGPVLIAFADTLFRSNTADIKEDCDGAIWVQKVDDPSAFGVVLSDNNGIIKDFVEKPSSPVSDLAIIGIYYFKNSEFLKHEMQYLVDNNVIKSGEYQLTDALQNMLRKNAKLTIQNVTEWLDCGNKNATVFANKRLLETMPKLAHLDDSLNLDNSVVVQPCFIGKNVILHNSVVGPYVSVGDNSVIKNSVITNSIIQQNANITNAVIDNSMIGSFVKYKGNKNELSIGDYSCI
jgi:glucose-1-phosphate thymidylyltransferase